MFRRSEEIKVRKVQNARGGDGEVTFYDWLLPEEAKGHGRVFSKLVVPPGASIGFHDHSGEYEAFYILSGEATIDDNGSEIVLNTDDMHLCEDGNGHGIKNNGSEELVLIALILNTLE